MEQEPVRLADITKVGEYLQELAEGKAKVEKWMENIRDQPDTATFVEFGKEINKIADKVMDLIKKTAKAQIEEAEQQIAKAKEQLQQAKE